MKNELPESPFQTKTLNRREVKFLADAAAARRREKMTNPEAPEDQE